MRVAYASLIRSVQRNSTRVNKQAQRVWREKTERKKKEPKRAI